MRRRSARGVTIGGADARAGGGGGGGGAVDVVEVFDIRKDPRDLLVAISPRSLTLSSSEGTAV